MTMLRVHTNIGVILVRFAPKVCPCGFTARSDERVDQTMGERPIEGDLEACFRCETFRVWRRAQWQPAAFADLERQIEP